MRSLFLTTWFPDEDSVNNGVFIKDHLEAIRGSGQEVDLMVIKPKVRNKLFSFIRKEEFQENQYNITCQLQSKFARKLYGTPFLLEALIKKELNFFKERNYDLIHSNVVFKPGILAEFLSRKLNIPYIISEHWGHLDEYLKNPFSGGFIRKAYSNAAFITVPSQHQKNQLSVIADERKIVVAPNIIDSAVFNFKTKKKKDKIVFLMVAKFNYPKRPDLVIKALNEIYLKDEFPFELRIIGGGPELEKALKTVQTQSLPFNLLGFQPKKVIAEELQKSDFFLHPTDSETFGIVVNEALSTGTPILASQIPAFQERIDAQDGILVQNNLESWVSGIRKLLQQQFDHKEISDRNSQLFSKERASKIFTDIYQRATVNQ